MPACTPSDVDYINAHGTSTPLGDIAETHRGQALRSATTRRSSRCSSTKSMTGHLLGAAGGIEAVFTVLAMRDQVAPPTINLVNQDPQCDLDYVPLTARPMKIGVALSNSFGFGGTNAHARVPRAVAGARRRASADRHDRRHGTDRPEIRRHVGRHRRAHQERRAARRALPARRATSRRRRGLGDDRRDQPPARARAARSRANPDPRELDVIASTGEQVTIGLLAMALHGARRQGAQLHRRAGAHPHRQRVHQGAHPRDRRGATYARDLDAGNVVVVAGFQGVDEDGNITTLGRGGSDTTGVALAAALKADECQIYTDVDGVYTTDPRIVPEARRLDDITFEEMLELASLGSKVLQIRSVEFAGKYKVQLRVLSSFEDPEGAGHADHIRGRREHGTGNHLRHRVQPRRSEDHGDGRAGPARHRLRDPRPDRRREHRRRHDRAERRRTTA